MLSYLVYVSERDYSCTQQDINNIISSAKKNNSKFKISGILLFSEDKFYHYMEGEGLLLTTLFDKIREDSRHNNPTILVNSPLEKRLFPPSGIESKRVDFESLRFRDDIPPMEKLKIKKILSGVIEEKTIPLVLKILDLCTTNVY